MPGSRHGQVPRQAVQGARPRRGVRMLTANPLDVLGGQADHHGGIVEMVGADLAAAVVGHLETDRLEGGAGAKAGRLSLDGQGAGGLDRDLRGVLGQGGAGHHRAGRVAGAEEQDGGGAGIGQTTMMARPDAGPRTGPGGADAGDDRHRLGTPRRGRLAARDCSGARHRGRGPRQGIRRRRGGPRHRLLRGRGRSGRRARSQRSRKDDHRRDPRGLPAPRPGPGDGARHRPGRGRQRLSPADRDRAAGVRHHPLPDGGRGAQMHAGFYRRPRHVDEVIQPGGAGGEGGQPGQDAVGGSTAPPGSGPRAWSATRSCCSSTSRPPASIPRPGARRGTSSAAWASSARPSC